MLNKRISLCYVFGNVHDINDDQEGQVPSLEMPCSSAEFHYTETEAEPLCCCARHWPFRTHHPEEMPISNIYWHGSILMCHCQQTVGECHRAVNTGMFYDMFHFSVTSCQEEKYATTVFRSRWGDFKPVSFLRKIECVYAGFLNVGKPAKIGDWLLSQFRPVDDFAFVLFCLFFYRYVAFDLWTH